MNLSISESAGESGLGKMTAVTLEQETFLGKRQKTQLKTAKSRSLLFLETFGIIEHTLMTVSLHKH